MCYGYQLAAFLKNDELIKICEREIAISPKIIFATDAFRQRDQSILKRILELNRWNCKETDALEACLVWPNYACKQIDLDETKMENLKSQLGDCCKSIRLDSMTIEEFTKFSMLNEGFFTPDEFKDAIYASRITR